MEITQRLLRQVQIDNIDNNQIGGKTDGITPEVAADLGYNTAEEVLELSTPQKSSNSLTSSQKNWRARREEEAHARRKEHPPLEPNAEALKNMSPETKDAFIKEIQNAKAALEAAKAGVSQAVEIEQLPEPIEPVQEQLPFDQ